MQDWDKKIRGFHLWSELPDTLWDELSAKMTQVCYEAGDTIFPNESTEESLCVLLEGKANVYAPSLTNRSNALEDAPLMRTMDAGALFGVHCIFQRDMKPQSLILASKPCRVLLVPSKDWERVLIAHPETMARYVRFLSERVEFLNRKIRYLTAGSAERKLALYLLSEIPQENTPVHIRASAVCMADLLDISRASLYRAINQLTKDGFLIRNGHEYRLLHRDKLIDHYH